MLICFRLPTGQRKKNVYKELNAKIELLCKWFGYAAIVTLLSIALFPLVYTSVAFCILDLGVDSFLLYPPTKYESDLKSQTAAKQFIVLKVSFNFILQRWLFNWKTPIGYLMAWFPGCAGVFIKFAITPFFNYLFGSSWLFWYIADDIITDLTAFNNDVFSKKCAKANPSNSRKRVELITKFCATVQIYTDAKQ